MEIYEIVILVVMMWVGGFLMGYGKGLKNGFKEANKSKQKA